MVTCPYFKKQKVQLAKAKETRLRDACREEGFHAPEEACMRCGGGGLQNAERLYHHPGSVGSRRWSGLARWLMRELNELPHYTAHRWGAVRLPAQGRPMQAAV